MKKTILASALALLSINSFADTSIPDVKSQMKVTANVTAGCDITAENINFGVLAMPIADVSASANINVVCSKNIKMSFAINYGETITVGSSQSNSTYTYTSEKERLGKDIYFIYKNGVLLGGINCRYDNSFSLVSPKGVDYSVNPEVAKLYGLATNASTAPVNNGGCNGVEFNTKKIPGIVLVGENITVGTLVGNISQEKITYSLSHPSSNVVWNNTNKYELTSTGVEQIIPMKANIKTAENPTHRMTPDTYSSSLNVVLTY